jgi:membrane protease subunit (stomatin/prohibitin family)
MGIFKAIKGEAQRNFIARPDTAKAALIWKHPENNVRMHTQLTVAADEVALFVKDGILQGKLGPGRHSLDTQNIPFLSVLLEQVTGGNLFVAQIYFVTMREVTGLKFGGPIGDVRDPETGLAMGTMVYGDFSFRVFEPERLVLGMVGLGKPGNEEALGWFKNQVLKTLKDYVAELLVKKQWPLLHVTSGAYTMEIEQEVLAILPPQVEPYGIRVVRFGNFTISIKPEDEATLKKMSKDAAYIKMAGGFQQYAQGQAMLNASEGMAKGGGGGGGASEGMGLAMGMGMAQMFMQQGQGQGRPPEGKAETRSVTERLKDLAELKAAGIVTEEEFEAKKAELMKLL